MKIVRPVNEQAFNLAVCCECSRRGGYFVALGVTYVCVPCMRKASEMIIAKAIEVAPRAAGAAAGAAVAGAVERELGNVMEEMFGDGKRK